MRFKLYLLRFFIYSAGAFVLFFNFSCSKSNSNSISVQNSSTSDTITNTYLALGDSYTIGQSVSEQERYPNITLKLLKDENIKINDTKIIAATGWTTSDLINAINNTPLKKNYAVITLLIGVNNQYQGKSIDEYKIQFTSLLNTAIMLAGNKKNHVFVISIPDYSVTPFAVGSDIQKISGDIDSFNSANKNISEQFGVNYLDITPISRQAADDQTLTADDGLHPSGKQYKIWSDLLAPLILKSL